VITVGLLANTCIEATGRFANGIGVSRNLGSRRDARIQSQPHARGARPKWSDVRSRHPDNTGVAGGVVLRVTLGPNRCQSEVTRLPVRDRADEEPISSSVALRNLMHGKTKGIATCSSWPSSA
jgi:hypothetical protein